MSKRSWERWMKTVHTLFDRKETRCVVCERAVRGMNDSPYRELSALCSPCRDRITWIRSMGCRICGRAESCPDCPRRPSAFLANRAAVTYSPVMKDWLSLYKYRGHEKLGAVFSGMLSAPFEHYVHEFGGDKRPFRCITYVPVSERRLSERGFNQAEQMACGLGARYRIPVIPLLYRNRHTDKQSYKTRSERLEGLHGAFNLFQPGIEQIRTLLNRAGVRGKGRILLVDDVYTTGSTLNECAKTIKHEIYAEIFGITWAR